MDQLIQLVQTKVPDFGRRVLTFEDFLAVCTAEEIHVELKRHPMDEQLLRKPLAKIILNAGLSERYRTFAGFHALAHWFGHPGRADFYLGSPGWLDTIELEASAIGYLAIAPPRRPGPPWPRLVRAEQAVEQLAFEVEYPEDFRVDEVAGSIARKTWRRQRTMLRRLAQMDFPFEGQGELL